MKVCVVGLGKLGAPMARVHEQAGHSVIGYDQVPKTRYDSGLNVTYSNLRSAVASSEVTLVIVPTPSNADGRFSITIIRQVIRMIGSTLASMKEKDRHLVVIKSTVYPGHMDMLQKDLEETSGRRVGEANLGLCYSPEFIALGDVAKQMRSPDVVLIGESDKRSGDELEELYRTIINYEVFMQCTVHRMNFINAEVAKLALNVAITAKIAYSNEVAALCDKLPDSNVDVVLGVVGSDPRIGPKILKAGLGFGGPCFPRDTVAFNRLARDLDTMHLMMSGVDESNIASTFIYATMISEAVDAWRFDEPATVAILGTAYKAGGDIQEGSRSLILAGELTKHGYKVKYYDPKLANGMPLEEVIKRCDVIFVANPEAEFIEAPAEWFKEKAVIDPWRVMGHILHTDQFGVGQ